MFFFFISSLPSVWIYVLHFDILIAPLFKFSDGDNGVMEDSDLVISFLNST